jgi:hypothetical protein
MRWRWLVSDRTQREYMQAWHVCNARQWWWGANTHLPSDQRCSDRAVHPNSTLDSWRRLRVFSIGLALGQRPASFSRRSARVVWHGLRCVGFHVFACRPMMMNVVRRGAESRRVDMASALLGTTCSEASGVHCKVNHAAHLPI